MFGKQQSIAMAMVFAAATAQQCDDKCGFEILPDAIWIQDPDTCDCKEIKWMECHPMYLRFDFENDCDQKQYDIDTGRNPDENPFVISDWYIESLSEDSDYHFNNDWKEDKEDDGIDFDNVKQDLERLSISVMSATYYGLQVFRYRAADDYYEEGDDVLGSLNYWKLADQVRGYGGFALWSLAATLQLAEAILPSKLSGLNLNVLRMLTSARLRRATNTVANILDMVAYEKGYTISQDDSETSTDQASATVVMAAVKSDMFNDMALQAATEVALWRIEKDSDDSMGDSSDDEEFKDDGHESE